MNNLLDGLIVMAYGLAGVFFVLILFYIFIVLLKKIFPYKEDDKN